MSDDEGDGLSAPILDMPALGASYSSDQPEMAITFIGDGSQAPAPPQRAPAARAAAPAAAPPVPLTPQQLQQLQYQQRLAQARQIDAATLKTWTTVYPRYLEEGVSAAQGRRLPRSKVAGCRGINVIDLAEGLLALGFPSNTFLVENTKRHPSAEPWMLAGRVRLELATKDGAPTVPAYATKGQVLVGLGRVIPTLESRRARIALHQQKLLEAHEAQRREHAKRTGQPLLAAGGGGGGGGGGRR